jgi:hypothetical protein
MTRCFISRWRDSNLTLVALTFFAHLAWLGFQKTAFFAPAPVRCCCGNTSRTWRLVRSIPGFWRIQQTSLLSVFASEFWMLCPPDPEQRAIGNGRLKKQFLCEYVIGING